MARRRAGYLTRQYRSAKRAMAPNRVAARFISGGRHQTFTAIVKSPLRQRTVTSGKNRRTQHQARERGQKRAEAAESKRERARAAQARRDDARYAADVRRAAAGRTPRKPRPKSPPIAVDPRTGKPITYAQAMKALKEAQERAERLAAGLPGDAPAKKPRAAKATTTPPQAAARPARKAAPRKKPAKKASAPPPPAVPGKTVLGLYYAAACVCQGTGRIYTEERGRITGSVSCPEHGRPARGSRRILSARAMADSGLPGLAGWLAAKYKRGRGNLDRKQRRAVNRAKRERHAGPTKGCDGCDAGIVNRDLTDALRARHIEDLIESARGAGQNIPPRRKLQAAARRAYPYDRCRACKGLGRVPSSEAGPWFERAPLREQHRPTAREKATGRRPAGR